ncbi:MAG: lysophospholipid acyltransferase family protein [Acidobacteria bacterium]|nr:lysophospholipid acyltransferase family protein [Acidobacteriota bacterium]
MRGGFKGVIEYTLALMLIKTFGSMPRALAYRAAKTLAWLGFHLARRQRIAGFRNLRMAMPELSRAEQERVLRACFQNLGRLLVEFTHFPELNKNNITKLVDHDGLENYLEGIRRGRGVIFLTGHFGAWELSCFAHSIYGYPLKFVVRPIDNERVDQFITRYRTMGGNRPIQRNRAGREILKALRNNEAVGILFDQNTTSDEGVFVDFFGIPAATTTAIAAFALRTGAAVVPGFLIWEPRLQKHRLRFDPPVELVQTGDLAHDVVENTKLFNEILEKYVRKYPDQWLWIHRRWKTRPAGQPPLY